MRCTMRSGCGSGACRSRRRRCSRRSGLSRDMTGAAILEPVQVASARVSVRPVEERDIDDLLEINGDPEVTRFLPYPTWQSRDDGLAWLKRMRALEETGTCRQLVVERNADAK